MIHSAVKHLRQEGFSEGLQKGRIEGVIEVAENMLRKGIDPETVIEYTQLSRNIVQKLRRMTDTGSGS